MVSPTVELLKNEIPFELQSVVITAEDNVITGLVLVDIINGFCTVGAGNLVSTQSVLNLKFQLKSIKTDDLIWF